MRVCSRRRLSRACLFSDSHARRNDGGGGGGDGGGDGGVGTWPLGARRRRRWQTRPAAPEYLAHARTHSIDSLVLLRGCERARVRASGGGGSGGGARALR